jgi:hypothetical protein
MPIDYLYYINNYFLFNLPKYYLTIWQYYGLICRDSIPIMYNRHGISLARHRIIVWAHEVDLGYRACYPMIVIG